MTQHSQAEFFALMRHDFLSLFEKSWIILNGQGAAFDRPYLAYIAAQLQRCENGEDLRTAFSPRLGTESRRLFQSFGLLGSWGRIPNCGYSASATT
jgi:hypothetical protein